MRFITHIKKQICISFYLLLFIQIHSIKLTDKNNSSLNVRSTVPSLDYDQMIPVEFEQPER